MAKSRTDTDHIEVSIVCPVSPVTPLPQQQRLVHTTTRSKLLPPLSLQYHSDRLSPAVLSEQHGCNRPRLDHSGWTNGSVYSGNRHSSYDTCLLSTRDDLSGSMPILYSGSVSCWELRDLTPSSETSTHPPDGNDDRSTKPLDEAHAASLAKAARNNARNNTKPLSKKAKWLIIVIGVILFGMSMLLVGITLRLAPMIDEMVRQEHKDFMQQRTQHTTASYNGTTSSPGDVFSSVNTTVT